MANIQLIRSATLKINYGGTSFLLDPMLGEKGSFESYGGIRNNPIIDLPMSAEEVIDNVDAVLVSHLHNDHFDGKAKEMIDKSMTIICQPGDKERISESGFTNIEELSDTTWINGIIISRTDGNHGRGPIEAHMGKVSGFVLEKEGEPKIYIVGDCIFNEKVKEAIDTYQPDVIITNSGGAFIPGFEENLILLDEQETIELASYAKNGKVVAVHLESLDHCTVSRASLKRAVLQSDLNAENFQIPLDGEVIEL